jgi:uncharacterized protein YdhG (YjbR/CyaY superfamily)
MSDASKAGSRQAPATVDAYIAGFSPDVQRVLQSVRCTIRDAAPGAEETISYQMPAYRLDGRPLVCFGAYKKHVGMYPVPMGGDAVDGLAEYAAGKGTARFPLDRPMPLDLVARIVEFWIRTNAARAAKGAAKSS